MRLKTFSAKTMKEAMAEVRSVMGPEAIIVSVEEGRKGSGVRVTAAVEGEIIPRRPPRTPRPEPTPAMREERRPARSGVDAADIKAAIAHHGLPHPLAERITELAQAHDADSTSEALAHAFEALLDFVPLALAPSRPIMFVGPPGAGKTVATAKLAAEAVVNDRLLRLITTDTVKSGGAQQLQHYGRLMKREVAVADGAEALAAAVAGSEPALTLIDSSGVNPFAMAELERLVHLIKAANAEPMLVLPAGLDPMEGADMADVFSEMGVRRLVATRLDAARRYAGLITAARAGRFALAGLGRSPYVAEPLETPSAPALARLLAALSSTHKRRRTKERIA